MRLKPTLAEHYYDMVFGHEAALDKVRGLPHIVDISEDLAELDAIAFPKSCAVELRLLKELVALAWAGADYEEVLNEWNTTDVTENSLKDEEFEFFIYWGANRGEGEIDEDDSKEEEGEDSDSPQEESASKETSQQVV
ncbi:hypothetical protein CALCODRAFT_516337 [Calocera cornea HHB12733]|uniref:Uncharacterized protein n=1 Tax=Calocera cornea HHB12733 TaxID=1353952 RepID=A0A165HBB9_9BASI|nr:hypothetical protein CALCODRAFT_516337 [Calocera cornea HHB12733]